MTRRLIVALLFTLLARPVSAQVVTGPTSLAFAHADTDFAITASYQLQFFQCASITNSVCQGQATSPMQSVTVPKSGVTSFAPDSNGDNRSISFTAAPVSGVLPSLPAGVAFVAALIANGDTSAGGAGSSAASAPSNPFYRTGRAPAAPSAVRAK